MIDICDFAVGLSRQLYGLTIATERPGHRMMETWHPLGAGGRDQRLQLPGRGLGVERRARAGLRRHRGLETVGEDAAYRARLQALLERACNGSGRCARALVSGPDRRRAIGACAARPAAGAARLRHRLDAHGPRGGRAVAPRFGRTSWNSAATMRAIVGPPPISTWPMRAIVFAAVGTAGQRCTIAAPAVRPCAASTSRCLRGCGRSTAGNVGNPLEEGTLVGPLIDEPAFDAMQKALDARARGAAGCTGGERARCEREHPDAFYVRPALVGDAGRRPTSCCEETFAPILYVMPYDDARRSDRVAQRRPARPVVVDLHQRPARGGGVLGAAGSDCGIANVNIGTSGAEIGGAFGGEKDTGGGRESGSDAWKAYMRRATNTINYSHELPLAQGIRFEVGYAALP